MRVLDSFLLACATLLFAARPAASQPAFGTAGSTPFQLRGQIYFLDEGTDHLPDFSRLQSRGTISTSQLNVPAQSFENGFPGVTDRFEWFALDYRGSFVVPATGSYRFRLSSDDGSRLLIDGQQVIDNDGIHGGNAVEGTAELREGAHSIEVQYFQGPRYEVELVLEWALPEGDFEALDFARYGTASFRREGNRLIAELGGSVLFDTNSAVLKPQALSALEELKASMIDPNPAARITVDGHTDDVGGDADNQRLSEARAQSVLRWLTDHGVAASRLSAHGYGETQPARPNDSAANRARNRRIQITVETP